MFGGSSLLNVNLKQGVMTNEEKTFSWIGDWIVSVGYDILFVKCVR
jgi:hypothetical protein